MKKSHNRKKVSIWGYIVPQNRFILIAILESIEDSTQEEIWFNALKITEQGTIFKVQEARYAGRNPELRARVWSLL